MDDRIIVIGGGPAGMMAAIAAAGEGAQVLLIEGNDKLGKKLYITGKGRCNLTNDCDVQEFLRNVPRNANFLRSCLARLDSRALMAAIEGFGVPLVTERGNRVFPASGKASDVTRALQRRMQQLGVRTHTADPCEELVIQQGRLLAVRARSGELRCRAAIVATGGMSYPSTGSTGDGYRLAAQAGHAMVDPVATLVPLVAQDSWPGSLTGLSLKNVELCASGGGKRLFRERGELLFTHFGLSGPLTLSLSAHLPADMQGVEVWIDLKPALTEQQVDARLLRELESAQRKQLDTVLATMLPRALAGVLPGLAGIPPDTYAHQITRAQRGALAGLMKRLPFGVKGRRPIEEAVVTRGGVDVRQVDPKTMRSKLVEGLYFAGEVLDVDGYTGGFNLQIAFSTGYAAGIAAAQIDH